MTVGAGELVNGGYGTLWAMSPTQCAVHRMQTDRFTRSYRMSSGGELVDIDPLRAPWWMVRQRWMVCQVLTCYLPAQNGGGAMAYSGCCEA